MTLETDHAISSGEATLERMEAEPSVMIRLSDAQAEQLTEIEAAAEHRQATRAASVAARPLGPDRARVPAKA